MFRPMEAVALPPEPVRAVLFDLDNTLTDRDLAGAWNAGIRGIWLDRRGAAATAGHEPRVGDLRHLPPLL